MSRFRTLVAMAPLVLIIGCSETPADTSREAASTPHGDQAGQPSSVGSAPNEQSMQARLVKTGFGQAGEDTWVTSLVENQSADNIGRDVIVQFSVYDDAGEIVASAVQKDSFSRADQLLAIGTQIDVPDQSTVVKAEATLGVSDQSSGAEPFPEIRTGEVTITVGADGVTRSQFKVHNPTEQSLEAVRVGVICYGGKGRVIGGGSVYPDAIAPLGSVVTDTRLIVSGPVDRCDAYAGPGEA
jgi:hypothetical protein